MYVSMYKLNIFLGNAFKFCFANSKITGLTGSAYVIRLLKWYSLLSRSINSIITLNHFFSVSCCVFILKYCRIFLRFVCVELNSIDFGWHNSQQAKYKLWWGSGVVKMDEKNLQTLSVTGYTPAIQSLALCAALSAWNRSNSSIICCEKKELCEIP